MELRDGYRPSDLGLLRRDSLPGVTGQDMSDFVR